jgi:hypothetical protein
MRNKEIILLKTLSNHVHIIHGFPYPFLHSYNSYPNVSIVIQANNNIVQRKFNDKVFRSK